MKRAVLSLLALLLVAALGLADGIVFKASGAWAPQGFNVVRPSIPSQRAVLKFDGREEILTIESVFQGPRGRYGWVVPLPTQPSYVKAVRPEYLATAFSLATPNPRGLRTQQPTVLAAFALVAFAVLLGGGLLLRRFDAGIRIIGFAVLAALALLGLNAIQPKDRAYAETAAFASQSLDRAAAKSVGGVQVRSLGTIGAYEVNVLSGEDGAELRAWLKKEGIVVPAESQPAIDAYLAEKWCFLAATVRKEDDRPLPAHPLKAVFPTDRPVYPMRLTGTQGSPVQLELLVVADRRAKVSAVRALRSYDDGIIVPIGRNPDPDDLYGDWKDGAYAMARPGEVATYLRGRVEPDQMAEDFKVEFEPYERLEVPIHPRDQAVNHAFQLAVGVGVWALVLLGFLPVLFPKRAPTLAVVAAVLALGLAGFYAMRWWRSVETVETTEADSPYYGYGWRG